MGWFGSQAILLDEYLRNKQKLSELKEKERYMKYREYDVSEIQREIIKIEQSIVEFICSLNSECLKEIIYMSLDMNVDVGYPDKLIPKEF
jgi:hypothetical protein